MVVCYALYKVTIQQSYMRKEFFMEHLIEKQTEEILFQELDKGIADMEQGHVVSHEEAMRILRERLSSYGI